MSHFSSVSTSVTDTASMVDRETLQQVLREVAIAWHRLRRRMHAQRCGIEELDLERMHFVCTLVRDIVRKGHTLVIVDMEDGWNN